MKRERIGEALPKPKYVLVPGHVISRYDGDRHYISSTDLARLYGLHDGEWTRWIGSLEMAGAYEGCTFLYPRTDGKYTAKGGT